MATDDQARFVEARERLSKPQLALVGACLRALVRGPYIEDDDEFDAVMGTSREEAEQVAAAWPEPAPHGRSFLVVNNALNNLLGYPHREWRRLTLETGADEAAVAHALMVWRDEDHRAGSGRGYFDASM